MTNNFKIPKIVHYCWFGNKEKPLIIREIMKSWCKLKDYQFIEWNEKNTEIKSNKYLYQAYSLKKYAFVSDYVRLKVLFEYGGIYLDTDVKVHKSFDNLLNNEMFLSFIFDGLIGTAVIGSIPKHPIISDLINWYEKIEFIDDTLSGFIIKGESDRILYNNNDIFTLYFLKKYPGFKLKSCKQVFDKVTIYPAYYFEKIPPFIFCKNYALHYGYGSWREDNLFVFSKKKERIKSFCRLLPLNPVGIYHQLLSKNMMKKTPFYDIYLHQI